jgi:Na+-driven multidrug efflux pump
MTTTMFLMLLSAFSVLSGIVTEAIKKLINDKVNLSYNIIALVVALIIGGAGCAIYYKLNEILFTTNNIIYMILMGFASGLVSMIGYDKVKQAIEQLTGKIE